MTLPFPCGPYAPAPGLENLAQQAIRDGYLYLPALLDPAVVLALRRRVLRQCRKLGWMDSAGFHRDRVPTRYDDPALVALQCRVTMLPEFDALCRAPRLLAVLRALGGTGRDDVAVFGRLCRLLPPGGQPTRPHQDGFYLGEGHTLWTVWLPLEDCPLEQGPLAVLPGSHRDGLRAHEGEQAPGDLGVNVAPHRVWAAGDLACGDVLLFNGLTLHRTCPNRTRHRIRLSMDFRCRLPGPPG